MAQAALAQKAILLVGLVCLAGLASVPEVAAQASPVFLHPGDPVLELYVVGPTLGAPMGVVPPAGTTVSKASLTGATGINPGTATKTILASFTPAAELKFTSDSVATLFLVADTQAGYDQIQANLNDGATVVATGNTPLTNPGTIGSATTVLRIPMATMGITLKAGTKYTFEAVVFGVGAPGTPSDLFVQFGAKSVPTGFLGAVNTPAAAATSASAYPLYLADKSLALPPPTSATDKTAPLTTSCTGACPALSGAVVYGKIAAPVELQVTGETVLTLYIDIAGTAPAGGSRQITATLTVGSTAYGSTLGPNAVTWTAAGAKAFRFGFTTRGITIKAGTDITLSYAFWSSSDSPSASFNFVYGSTTHPAALMIPVPGGASSPTGSVRLLANSTHLQAAPGKTVTTSLLLRNLGTAAANVTLNATGNLTTTISPAGPMRVLANTTLAAANVTFAIPSTASPGTRYNQTIRARVAGHEVANLTFSIEVAAPTTQGQSPGGGTGATGGTGTGGTAPGGGTTATKAKGTPGLGAVGMACALLGATWPGRGRWRRR